MRKATLSEQSLHNGEGRKPTLVGSHLNCRTTQRASDDVTRQVVFRRSKLSFEVLLFGARFWSLSPSVRQTNTFYALSARVEDSAANLFTTTISSNARTRAPTSVATPSTILNGLYSQDVCRRFAHYADTPDYTQAHRCSRLLVVA